MVIKNKAIKLILIICIILSFVFVTISLYAGDTLFGDVNNDGKINSTDNALIERYTLGMLESLTAQNAADVNGDNKINSTDNALITRYMLGIIDSFSSVKPSVTVTSTQNPKVEELLNKMTLDEKVGQMIQPSRDKASPTDVKNYFLGSVLSGGGSVPGNNKISDWQNMTKLYQDGAKQTRLGIPIIYGVDAVHGHNNVINAVIFPHNIGLGAANDARLMEDIADVTAKEIIATGVNWNFAPCIAVSRNPQWGRMYESYGENPDIVCNLVEPYIKGLQKNFVIATAKHYVADGATSSGSGKKYYIDQGNSIISEDELRKIHLPGYKKAIESGVKTVMASFSSVNGLKCHENKYLITDVLKNELGFKGFVISDWEATDQLSGATFYDQVVQATNAGVDMFMEPEHWKETITALKDAVSKKDITQERIDDAVRRILNVKFDMGIFDNPLGNQSLASSDLALPQNIEVAKKAVRESLVLLKNQNNILPLKKNLKVFVTGPAADNIGIQCGGWTKTWQGGQDRSTTNRWTRGTTILDGFKKVASSNGGTIITNLSEAKNADVAVVVIGEKPYAEGEGDDKELSLNSGMALTDNVTALNNAKTTGLPIITIMVSGRPRIITNELKDWNAFVEAWYPGSEGEAVSDVIYGDYSFVGKLPVTWPDDISQIPINYNNLGDRKPLFEYGFGLTTK